MFQTKAKEQQINGKIIAKTLSFFFAPDGKIDTALE